jgi:very-short-patch-repair endonuclease
MGLERKRRPWWHSSEETWKLLKPLARQKRHEPTVAENQLWQRLRNRQVGGIKFRRQYAIDRFIVDFYSKEGNLIIEVDGPIHDYTPEEDKLRQEFLESLGFRVVRFTNEHVLKHTDEVIAEISAFLQSPPRRYGEGAGE